MSDARLFWKKHVVGWRASGETAKRYSAKHGLAANSLVWWASRLKRDGEFGEAAMRWAKLEVAGAVLETDIPRLSLMLPGGPQARDAEPLASGNMQRLLEELSERDRNRVVLIDAPSCLDTSDPAMLARVVGQTVLVVEAHATQQQGVEAALDLLHPCENTYLVLNKSRTS